MFNSIHLATHGHCFHHDEKRTTVHAPTLLSRPAVNNISVLPSFADDADELNSTAAVHVREPGVGTRMRRSARSFGARRPAMIITGSSR